MLEEITQKYEKNGFFNTVRSITCFLPGVHSVEEKLYDKQLETLSKHANELDAKELETELEYLVKQRKEIGFSSKDTIADVRKALEIDAIEAKDTYRDGDTTKSLLWVVNQYYNKKELGMGFGKDNDLPEDLGDSHKSKLDQCFSILQQGTVTLGLVMTVVGLCTLVPRCVLPSFSVTDVVRVPYKNACYIKVNQDHLPNREPYSVAAGNDVCSIYEDALSKHGSVQVSFDWKNQVITEHGF